MPEHAASVVSGKIRRATRGTRGFDWTDDQHTAETRRPAGSSGESLGKARVVV